MPVVPLLPLLDPSSSLDVPVLSKVLPPFLVQPLSSFVPAGPCSDSKLLCVHSLHPRTTRSAARHRPSDSPAPPWTSESRTPSRSVDSLALPWLLAPSFPPLTIIPLALPGPRVPCFNFISRHSGFATGFQAYSFRSAIHPFGSIKLCLLPVSTLEAHCSALVTLGL